jgi:sialidase-1
MKIKILVCALALLSSGQFSGRVVAQSSVEGDVDSFLRLSRLELNQVFTSQRFPNVVVTLEGVVVATFGSDGVRAKRSEDGGLTWGEEIEIASPGFQGAGTTVDEATGDLLTFVEDRHPPAPVTQYRSHDGGKIWSAEPFVAFMDSRGNAPSMHMNEHGITLRHGKFKGRLIRTTRYYGKKNGHDEWPTHYTNAIFSDDGGKVWHTSDPFPENGTGEAAVVELSDGSIYYNSRVHWEARPRNIRRRDALSTNGGMTWENWRIVEALPDGPQDTNYGCMGGLTRLPVKGKDILIYSNCDSPSGRHHGSVWASFDGGRTWPIKRLVYEGKFAYSSMTSGRPGTPTEGWIYLHFEGGPKGGSTVARFNLAWVLDGVLTGDGVIPGELYQ